MRKYLTIAAAIGGLALSPDLYAAESAGSLAADGTPAAGAALAQASPPMAPAPAAAPEVSDARPGRVTTIPPSGTPIVIEAGKGTLVRLPRPASTVFIANPDVADVQVKSPSLIYVTAKAPGQTALYAVDAEDRVLLNSPVRVEHDLSRVRQSLSSIAPGENVAVSSVDNSLVLSGRVSSAGRAETVRSLAASIASETRGNVVNRLSVATPNQVNIRVRVAEVNRTVLKSLGVNWSKLAGDIQFVTGNPVTGGQITARNTLRLGMGGYNALTFATLDALAQEGLLTTLAEPNLTATNGQPASFVAGGEFPIPVGSGIQDGRQTITIEFKTFGVSLDVTPTIVDPDHLVLKIRSEVSDLSSEGAIELQGIRLPALTVRRAETTVELASGQSFMLAGLLSNKVTQDISKIPGLGDIPILGQLFRSQRFERGETELMIIVTPYLVRPAMTSLAVPTDGFYAPHDAQRLMHADAYRQALPAAARGPVGPGGQGLVGPVGFRLD
jgi:pilus assembly protein CpaC